MTQRKRWLKTREFEKGECVAVRRPGKADTDRNAKRPPFVCVLVWVYFVHERFESGFRDLTLCVKVLRWSTLINDIILLSEMTSPKTNRIL